MTSSSDSAHRAQGTQPRVCEGPRAQGPRRTLWAPKFPAAKAERGSGPGRGQSCRARVCQTVAGCWFGLGAGRSPHSPPHCAQLGEKYRCHKCVPPVAHARGGERQAPLTAGRLLRLLWAASSICTCVCTWPLPHGSQSTDMRSVPTAQGGVRAAGQGACPLSPSERETGLRTPWEPRRGCGGCQGATRRAGGRPGR